MYEYHAIVDRVVDGDTIDVTIDLGFHAYIKTRVRMEGMNAPESRTRNLEEKTQGIITKEFLKTIMHSTGGHFVLKSHGVGKYGRCIGTIYVGGENINERLLAEGYAKRYGK